MAIFHELHPDPIFCRSDQWNKLCAGITDGLETLVDDLQEKKLVATASNDDVEFETAIAALERKLSQPTILYLMTAQGCNFGCTYCPVPAMAKRYGETLLSCEDALAGIDLWQEHLRERYDASAEYFVIFYGGEPLLNKETIKVSLARIEEKKVSGALPPNVNAMIVTNGSLIDDETVSLCQKHEVTVAVGLDGPRALNDGMKIDSNGGGTFDRIVGSINLLVKGGVRTNASVSITPHNIDYIAEYSTFFRSLGVEKFGFNFLKGRLLLELVGRDGLEMYYRQASWNIIEQARCQGKPGFEYQMEKKQNAFDQKDFFPVDCTCYGNQLVIQPDGQISNCPFCKTWLGHVRSVEKDFRIWNQPIIKEWRRRLPIYHPGDAKALSGGGCAWSSTEIMGNPLATDDASQIFAEEVLDELIWSRYHRLHPET